MEHASKSCCIFPFGDIDFHLYFTLVFHYPPCYSLFGCLRVARTDLRSFVRFARIRHSAVVSGSGGIRASFLFLTTAGVIRRGSRVTQGIGYSPTVVTPRYVPSALLSVTFLHRHRLCANKRRMQRGRRTAIGTRLPLVLLLPLLGASAAVRFATTPHRSSLSPLPHSFCICAYVLSSSYR